ncbi:MAG TPA: nitroreductase family protein [Spongiibacteraceae bacterium]|jgi:nitroreductase|nr:nitroreductase family protein [Spongiibacteraceae bacterium]HUH36955.1 nitroreductase family protein [Spongiibacteraceae bacterium]
MNLLVGRSSAPQLTEPAPDAGSLEQMFAAALRAPDHARLTPWRFLTIAGDARHALGELFVRAAEARSDTPLDAAAREKLLAQPLRAPLLVVVIASLRDHPKVPAEEQLLSAGCAAHALLLAAEAQGFAGIWRTGPNATDPVVKAGLGLTADEHIVSFMYLGTRARPAKPSPQHPPERFVQTWRGEPA